MIRSGDNKSIAHLDYWMGSLLANLVARLGLSEEAVVTPEYFACMGDCMAELMISEVLTVATLPTITKRLIYRSLANFPTPKISVGSAVDYNVIWRRFQSSSINPEAREHFFCSCVRTSQCWSWVRLKILGVCHQGLQSSNWELLNLVLPQNLCEENIIWLILSNFVMRCG